MPPRRRIPRQEPRAKTPPPQQQVPDPLANLYDALRALPGLRMERDPEARQANFFKDFIKLNPLSFDGRPDPTLAERWLRDIKRTFATIGTPAEFQVTFETYKLIDRATNWWETVKLSQDVTGMSWDTFERLFRSHYANASHRASMIREYERPRQGDMTVNEYYV